MVTRTSTPPRYAGALAVLVALLGAGLLVYAVIPGASSPTPPTGRHVTEVRPEAARPPAAHTVRSGVGDRIRGPVLPVARPLTVTIPRLHIASGLVALGLDTGGAMEVPQDPATAGWYRPGPTPGTLGPAVIAGHVTWNQTPGVFFRLAELRPRDVVQVVRDDDRVAVFRVTQVKRYPKAHFPTLAVFGGTDRAALRLITCGGQYDGTAHRYRDNVVAFARLVSAHRTRSPNLP